VMTGANTSAHDLSSEHGSTSSGEDLDGILDNNRRTSSSVKIQDTFLWYLTT